MKVGVVGSRTFTDYNFLEKTLKSYLPFILISGGAKGADTLAEQFAARHSIGFKVYRPDYVSFGKSATYVRNKKIVDESDLIIAFWDGKSKGTKMTIEIARRESKPYKIFYFNKRRKEL